jgi:hypothetical protein
LPQLVVLSRTPKTLVRPKEISSQSETISVTDMCQSKDVNSQPSPNEICDASFDIDLELLSHVDNIQLPLPAGYGRYLAVLDRRGRKHLVSEINKHSAVCGIITNHQGNAEDSNLKFSLRF